MGADRAPVSWSGAPGSRDRGMVPPPGLHAGARRRNRAAAFAAWLRISLLFACTGVSAFDLYLLVYGLR